MRTPLLIILMACMSLFTYGQTTVLDFESAGTSTDFQYFGNDTLDNLLTKVIANPNSTAPNTSANVVEFRKTAAAQSWAGAFSNPDPSVALDFITADEICIKVHFDHLGVLALKLENSATGDNWIDTMNNTVVNGWEELCFDVTKNSIEAPFTAAAGHIYPRLVLFFDFNIAGTGTLQNFYFDDVVLKGSGSSGGDVTFSVDMNDYSGTFDTVYVSGAFNGWNGTSNPLSDPDMDGVWSGVINMPAGLQEFKFTLDNWAVQEEFNGYEECTVTDPSGQFHNRAISVNGDDTLDTYCWNSCYACGEGALITFHLNMNNEVVDTTGVYIAGGGNFGNPGDFRMTDDDGDGVYSITVERMRGFGSYYTFTNGACANFSCKEDISGQPCADPANFNDRRLPPVNSGDTTISTCFAVCSNDTSCSLTSINDLIFNKDLFTVAPSPTSDYTTVTFSDERPADKVLTVFDITGKAVINTRVDAYMNEYKLNVSGLGSGLYFINVKTDNNFGTQKIVVE